MLAIPLQRGSSVNVTENFYSLLKTQYGDNASETLKSEIASFQSLRDSAVLIFEPTDVGIQTLQRLNFQYSSLVPRLNGYQNELRVSYRWQDGFRTSKSIMTTCLYVDWACFMFNLAALQSKLGSKTERTSDEGIKLANKYFQQAAGLFDYILHKIMPFFTSSTLTASSTATSSAATNNNKTASTPSVSATSATSNSLLSGLSNAGLTMARDLMLAQAQLCFYEKAVREKKVGNMKAAIVAKLALQTSTYFDLVKRSLTTEPLVSIFDPSWSHHADYQLANFKTASEYWQAVASKEMALEKGKGYGEEIARLIRAERIILAAIKEGQRVSLNPGLITSAEVFCKTIQTARIKAEQENNTIYMDNIPFETSLSAIVPASMVKPMLTLITDYNTNEPLLFQRVMPSIVRQYNSSFNTQMESILMKASTDAGTASNDGRTALSAIGLPGSLEAYKTGGTKLPDNLWNKIYQVQLLGLKAELDTKLSTLEGSASRAMQCMANIFGTIQREERIDNEFRSKYSSNNSSSSPRQQSLLPLLLLPPSSSMLNNDIRTSLQQMRDAFSKAQENDVIVKQQIQDVMFLEQLNILSKSREEISIILNNNNDNNTSGSTNNAPALIDFMIDDLTTKSSPTATTATTNTSALESKLLEMAQLIGSREQALAKLEAIGNTDISQELMNKHSGSSGSSGSASGVSSDAVLLAVVNQHVQMTTELLSIITQSIQRQPILLQEIIKANESFQKACTQDPIILARNQVIQSLEQSVSKFFNYHAQLSAGITFYTNFQSRLSALQQSGDDLVYTQQLQRQEYEHNLAQEHLRQSQELDDRLYAEKLAQDMQRQMSINSSGGSGTGGISPSSSAPLYGTGSTSTSVATENIALNFYPQIPAAIPTNISSSNSNSYNNTTACSPYSQQPHHQQQQPQYQRQQTASGGNSQYMPSPYEVSYGQPVSSPPAAVTAATTAYSLLAAPQYSQQHQPIPAVHHYQYNQPTTSATAATTYPPVQNNYNNNNNPYNNNLSPSIAAHNNSQQQSQQQQPQADPQLHQKALRLVEMGFSYDNCIQALKVNNGDEMSSLNSLLSSSSSGDSTSSNNNASTVSSAPPSTRPPSSSATPPVKPPVGLFGKWGGK